MPNNSLIGSPMRASSLFNTPVTCRTLSSRTKSLGSSAASCASSGLFGCFLDGGFTRVGRQIEKPRGQLIEEGDNFGCRDYIRIFGVDVA